MQTTNDTSPTTASPSVSYSNLLALYHLLWQQQDDSVIRRGFTCNVVDMEENHRVHSFTFDLIDLSRHPRVRLPNGMTSMVIRSDYKSVLENVTSFEERNFVLHGSAGIGKSYFLVYTLVMRLLARQPVTYRIDQPNSCVMCFTADGFFALPEENCESHPLFQLEDMWHLIDSTHRDSITYSNTDHTRALMWSRCGKVIFTTFFPDRLGFKIEWSPLYDAPLRRWMRPCTWDEIFAMSILTADKHNPELLKCAYAHFGSNAHVCLRVSQHPGLMDHYLNILKRAHDDFCRLEPSQRKLESLYSRSLFAVQPGEARAEPLPYPVSQVASRLLADVIVSSNPSAAKTAVDHLLNSKDTGEAGETFYRHTVVALMSRIGGAFELRCPDWQEHCERAPEDLVLCPKDVACETQQAASLRYTYCTADELLLLAENYPRILLSPKHTLVHPGIDAIMFDANTSKVWLMQVTYGSPRLISPEGLLFLLSALRGSAYEPSPLRPWKFVFATRGQSTSYPFELSGLREHWNYYFQFWDPRIESYFMQLRDTAKDLDSSSSPYEQWGFPYRTARKSSPSFTWRLANWLAHLTRRAPEAPISERVDQLMVERWATLTRASGAPGAQLLAEMISEQPVEPGGFYMRIRLPRNHS